VEYNRFEEIVIGEPISSPSADIMLCSGPQIAVLKDDSEN
jgi:hypothetical protein